MSARSARLIRPISAVSQGPPSGVVCASTSTPPSSAAKSPASFEGCATTNRCCRWASALAACTISSGMRAMRVGAAKDPVKKLDGVGAVPDTAGYQRSRFGRGVKLGKPSGQDVEGARVRRNESRSGGADGGAEHLADVYPAAERERVLQRGAGVQHPHKTVAGQHSLELGGEDSSRKGIGSGPVPLGEVDVAVPEPGYDHRAGAIHQAGVGRDTYGMTSTHRSDDAPRDQDDPAIQRRGFG